MEKNVEHVLLSDRWEAVIYREWDFPPDVIEAWNRMADATGDTGIFISYGWFENWWKAFKSAEIRLLIIVLAKHNKIDAIFPCSHRIAPIFGRKKEYYISSLTNDHSCLYDFIIDPTVRKEALAQFIVVLKKIHPDSKLFFEYMKTSGGNFQTFISTLHSSRMHVKVCTFPWAPWTTISGNTDSFTKNFPRKFMSNLRRCRKKALELGQLSLDVIKGGESLDSILDKTFEIEYKSWKGRNGTAIKCDPAVEEFYRRIAHWAVKNSLLHLFILKAGENTVSMSFCLKSGKTLFGLKLGYDEAYKDLSPGSLVIWESINYLLKTHDTSVFDFSGACEPWKMDWLREKNEYGWIKVYPNSLKGWYEYTIDHGWKDYLKKVSFIRNLKSFWDDKMALNNVNRTLS